MDRLRAWWFARQGLGAPGALRPGEIARRFGWLRSVGSANPYLAIHARTGAGRVEIESAVSATELVEVPAARGCTYYVPREDAALALRLASVGNGSAEFKMAERHLGVTEAEVAGLADAVQRALEEGPLDPRAISTRVSPRHLGDEGKRRGMTSTLPLALSRLQIGGHIRRLPQEGRLDTERFRYARWVEGPRPTELDETTVAQDMAARYFDWAGPATEREFRDFTGLPARLTKTVLGSLSPCPDDPTRLMRSEDIEAFAAVRPTEGRTILLASIDSWLHLRRNHASLMDETAIARLGTGLTELDSHPIVLDGAVVGLWEFDHAAQRIAAKSWRPSEAVERAVAETEAWIAGELGDFRAFSLDSPKSREKRIELLRSAE